MAASYSSKEVSNEEEPVPDMVTLPSEEDHRMPDGSIHQIQVGLRMVETFRERCQELVEEDPLKPVAVVYEEQLTLIKSQLDDANLEEFLALCPTLSALSPSLYRYLIITITIIFIIKIIMNTIVIVIIFLQLEKRRPPSHSGDPSRD